MIGEELLRKVRLIEIGTRRKVDDLMGGSFRSSFKGSGVQFSEHRLYVPGDDVRHIDWKISARTRDPLVKKFEEERELTVLLLVDISGSQRFGSLQKLKSEVAAEVAALITHAAVRAGDKVGVILFSGKVEKIIPPRKGRSQVLRIIREILLDRAPAPGTALGEALDSAARVLKHSGVVFVLSDFLAQGYELPLRRLSRRHDVVALNVRDLREDQVPEVGQLLVQDPESGQDRWIDTASYGFRKWLEGFRKEDQRVRRESLRGGKVEELVLQTREDYGDVLVRFFRARAQKKGK